MTRGTRAGLLAAALAVLVAAFVLLRPSDDEQSTTAGVPTAAATAAEETATAPAATDQGPLLTGGSVTKIRVNKGATVRFRVRSPKAEEVHVHGYDIKRELKASETANVSFKATIDGIFEIELEGSSTQIAELRVDP